MSTSDAVMAALAAARAAGVALALDGDRIAARTKTGLVPVEVLDLLKPVKSDLVRILKCREVVTESELVEAITTYFAAYREWRGPPDMLFNKIGHRLDEEEAILCDLLSMARDALAERGITMEISGGYVVLTPVAPDLVEEIVAYMADRVEVSALPERLLTVMKQPVDDVDEAILLDQIMMLEDDLAGRGIALRYEPASSHVVLERCSPRSAPATRPIGASE
jgi:hypothetical protein